MEPRSADRNHQESPQHSNLHCFSGDASFRSIRPKAPDSKDAVHTEEWRPPATGGNQLSQSLDTHRGIDRYVSLCFTRSQPMVFLAQRDGRLPNPRYLTIYPEALKINGTKVAFGVANATDVETLPVEGAIGRLDVEVIYSRTNRSDPAIQQRLQATENLEILVRDNTPRKFIAGVT